MPQNILNTLNNAIKQVSHTSAPVDSRSLSAFHSHPFMQTSLLFGCRDDSLLDATMINRMDMDIFDSYQQQQLANSNMYTPVTRNNYPLLAHPYVDVDGARPSHTSVGNDHDHGNSSIVSVPIQVVPKIYRLLLTARLAWPCT
jgi:hypothetical protein